MDLLLQFVGPSWYAYSMMIQIENVKPGQTFTLLGVEYKMLRIAGEVDQPKRNNWGRLIGGTYRAHRCAVKVNRHHKGWWFSYLAVPLGASVIVEN